MCGVVTLGYHAVFLFGGLGLYWVTRHIHFGKILIMPEGIVVNGYLLPIHLTYKEIFCQFIPNQLGEDHLDSLAVNRVVVLIGLIIIFTVFEVWFQVPKFSKDPLAQ